MNQSPSKSVTIRDLQSYQDLEQAEALEKEVWELADRDVTASDHDDCHQGSRQHLDWRLRWLRSSSDLHLVFWGWSMDI